MHFYHMQLSNFCFLRSIRFFPSHSQIVQFHVRIFLHFFFLRIFSSIYLFRIRRWVGEDSE